MRKSILHLVIFTFFTALLGFISIASAQVYTAPNYYYNNFDGGAVGSGFTAFGGASLAMSPINLATGTGYSLGSTGNGVAGGYDFSFISAGTNLNNDQLGYEWTLLYRNSGGNTDDSKTIDNNKNSWKYWLFANNTSLANMQGYYLTQNGSNLEIRISNSGNDNRALLSVNLSSIGGNNTTYAIRVQRIKQNGQSFKLFIDAYTSSTQEATTLRAETNSGEVDTYKIYNYAGLQVSSTSLDRFKFDEIKMYSRKLEIAGANDPAYGFSNSLYDGQKNAVIYALKFSTRGLFAEIHQIQTEIEQSGSASFADIVENTRLFRSTDNYFGNADDVLIDKNQSGGAFTPTINYRTLQANNFKTQIFNSVGTPDGSVIEVGFLFFKVDLKWNASAKGTFKISKLTKIGNDISNVNFVNIPDVVGEGTTTSEIPAGNVRDWTGNISTDWNLANNWSPVGVPADNDLARIGVITFTNQPTVTTNKTVGNIIFGTAKVATLVVNAGISLSVNNNIENQKGITISGAGSLTINGSYLAKPTGTNAASLTVANGVTLKLNGANPFSLGATSNIVTLNTGSTVIYTAMMPQDINTSLVYSNLIFAGAGVKKVAAGTLNVSGNWISSGGKIDFQSNNAKLSFNGAAQTINDTGSDGGKGMLFGDVNFTGGNTKTLSGKFAVAEGAYLTMGDNTTLQANNNMTMKASALGSASIGVLPKTASIKGQVTVEKYIQGGDKGMWRTYRMFGSPVYDNTSVFINEDVVGNRTYSFNQFVDDMIISGVGGVTNGFDQTPNNQAGAWTYNNTYIPIPNINTSINVGRGAYLYYRGNKDNFNAKVAAPYVDPESIIMTFKGVLNQQNITVPLTHGSSAFSLVANPYAATIDWNSVVRTNNVEMVVRVFNPSNRQYAVFNGFDGVNGGSQYIAAGQSFFVQTKNNLSPSITFTESAKYNPKQGEDRSKRTVMQINESGLQLNGKSMMAMTENTVVEEPARIRVHLQKDNTENVDETLIVFKSNEEAKYGGNDVLRSGGEVVFLSSQSLDSKELAINYMPNVAEVARVPLSINVSVNGNYTLAFQLSDMPIGYEVKLKDNYLNTLTNIGTSHTTYSLNVDKAISASFGANRFEIMLSPQTTLPVVITAFNAVKINEGVSVKWTTGSGINHNHFILERSGEDKTYTNIATVAVQENGVYQVLDKTPLIGYNYYRLVQVDKDGKTITLDPIAIKYDLNDTSISGLSIYPTITHANYTLKYNGTLSSTHYEIRVSDVNGKTILSEKIQKLSLVDGYQGILHSVGTGVYFVQLIDISTAKSIGFSKLIKR